MKEKFQHHIGNEISVPYITCTQWHLATEKIGSDNQYSLFDCMNTLNEREGGNSLLWKLMGFLNSNVKNPYII